jgi:hypothetical protein
MKAGTLILLVIVLIVAPSTVMTVSVTLVITPETMVDFSLTDVPVWPPPMERKVVSKGGQVIVVFVGRTNGGNISVQGGMHSRRGFGCFQMSGWRKVSLSKC